jgi:hypothetical protein
MVDEYMSKIKNKESNEEPAKRSPKNAIAPDEREKERQRKESVQLLQNTEPSSLEDYLK